jgi:fibronectin-binding autotransporter adhesin
MGGGTLDLNAYNQVVGGLSGTGGTVTNNGSGTPVLTVNQTGTSTFSGLMAGNIALTKSGDGTANLTNTNTYTGATNVNAGTLIVNGAIAISASPVTVNSGGTLGGTGLIERNVVIAPGGTLAPGAGIGAIPLLFHSRRLNALGVVLLPIAWQLSRG